MGSIRGAARSLNLSQAAITHALRELEDYCRTPLLIRGSHGLNFTEAGKILLDHARLTLKQLQLAKADIMRLQGNVRKSLCIGVMPWVASTFLPETVIEFRKRMPEVQLEFYESNGAVSHPLLRGGSMDFSIGYFDSELSGNDFDNEPLLAFTTNAIVRRGHPLQNSSSIHELMDLNWALDFTVLTQQKIRARLFRKHGAHLSETNVIACHSLSLIMLLLNADMCTYGPTVWCQTPPLKGNFVIVPLKDTFDPIQLNIITRRGSTRSTAASCFIDCLMQVIDRYLRADIRNS